MHKDALSDEVLRFLVDSMDTVPELEALMLLRASAPRAWTAEALAARVYVAPEEAQRIGANLERKGLVGAAPGGGWAFDRQGALANTVEQVALAYREQLVKVARVIHDKGSRGVREFARAFDIKKER